MDLSFLAVLAILFLALAAYAHSRLGVFTRGTRKTMATRIFLVLVAIGFGWVMSSGADDRLRSILLFLAGFGMVHVPAAVILFIKGRRGSGRT